MFIMVQTDRPGCSDLKDSSASPLSLCRPICTHLLKSLRRRGVTVVAIRVIKQRELFVSLRCIGLAGRRLQAQFLECFHDRGFELSHRCEWQRTRCLAPVPRGLGKGCAASVQILPRAPSSHGLEEVVEIRSAEPGPQAKEFFDCWPDHLSTL